MADIVDRNTRSRMMSAIRSKNTKPEIILRRALHATGLRYRLHASNLPGKPDLVFPKYRTIVFIHGCFWHSHSCKAFKIPETNSAFWKKKLEANRKRDKCHSIKLKQIGWKVIVVWECHIMKALILRQIQILANNISSIIKSNCAIADKVAKI